METSPAKTPLKSLASLPQELDELYVSLRGSPYVTALFEAKKRSRPRITSKHCESCGRRAIFTIRCICSCSSRTRRRNERAKTEIQKISTKQEKLKSVLALFAEVAQQLEKLARVQPEEPLPLVSPLPQKIIAAIPAPAVADDFCRKFLAAEDDAAQFPIVREWFHTSAVEAEKFLQLGALYSLRFQGRIHLLQYVKRNAAMATLVFVSVLSGKPLKPIPLEAVLELGAKQLLHRLLPKNHPDSAAEQDTSGDYTVAIINKGSFTQLQMAAQATGLLPNADAIGFIRDHEFRIKKYQECFDRIEGLYIHLRTAADQRLQRLRQEEMSYKSGVLKMSPKQWLTKQQRDTAMTQIILRALRYFTKVLDGLRILQTTPEAAPR